MTFSKYSSLFWPGNTSIISKVNYSSILYVHTHTHTHTYIYIYIHKHYLWLSISLSFSLSLLYSYIYKHIPTQTYTHIYRIPFIREYIYDIMISNIFLLSTILFKNEMVHRYTHTYIYIYIYIYIDIYIITGKMCWTHASFNVVSLIIISTKAENTKEIQCLK